MSLLYRPDWDEARARLTSWWNGGDMGRPAMLISCPRAKPIEEIPALTPPRGWVTDYSTSDFEYRVNLALRSCIMTEYLGEAAPVYASGDLAPNCLALYLGCRGVEMPGTVWCEPCIDDPDTARFEYDPLNCYWKFSLDLYQRVAKAADGKFLQQFPDLIEGLDTLSAMRGSEKLLHDLIDRPVWVHASLRQITDRYFRYYDILYDRLRDEVGGSHFWIWAPGRMVKLQCDFSAMISPAMYREFMVPVLTEMSERVSYCQYHWDGPGAIGHHDALLGIAGIDMLQWTPGAGSEPSWHKRWWPMYRKTLEAGKKLSIGAESEEHLLALRREFGSLRKGMAISMQARNREEAQRFIQVMED